VAVALTFVVLAGRLMLEIIARGRIPIRIALATAAILLVGTIFLISTRGASLLDSVLWHKAGSASATFRMATVSRALTVARDTYGLGAGLGSNRALSLFAYIGSNLGIFGLVAFVGMLGHLVSKVFGLLRDRSNSMDAHVALLACAAAFLVNLIGMTIAGAEISSPRTWILWAMLLAGLRTQSLTTDKGLLAARSTSRTGAFYPARSAVG
jgi:hypothetical protein